MGTTAHWYEFEIEIAKLLRAADFEVTPNAKAAKPRQTDLFARSDRVDLLVEAKNQKRKVGVGDIDALRARLNRTSADVVGVIFTTSKLTRGAIEAIETDRTREVLAFVKEEIEQLRSGTQNLKPLIDRKRSELRGQGRAWFSLERHSEFVGVKLPRGSIEFRVGSSVGPHFESKSKFAGATFALQIPDSGWGISSGEGARLSLELTLSNFKDLRNIVGYLHDKFGLSNKGMFAIHQTDCCWYGAGVENFLQAVEHWRRRYSKSRARKFHHSESFSYFDKFGNGWLELSSQQRINWDGVGKPNFLHHSELVIQLSGVPIDSSLFLKLCQYTGNDWAQFCWISEKLTTSKRLKKSLKLHVVGTVIDKETYPREDWCEERIVIGVIAKNPFYLRKSLQKEVQNFTPSLQELRETELLICALQDHHMDGDVVDHYLLEGFEITEAGTSQIIRPFGTWNRMLKKANTMSPKLGRT